MDFLKPSALIHRIGGTSGLAGLKSVSSVIDVTPFVPGGVFGKQLGGVKQRMETDKSVARKLSELSAAHKETSVMRLAHVSVAAHADQLNAFKALAAPGRPRTIVSAQRFKELAHPLNELREKPKSRADALKAALPNLFSKKNPPDTTKLLNNLFKGSSSSVAKVTDTRLLAGLGKAHNGFPLLFGHQGAPPKKSNPFADIMAAAAKAKASEGGSIVKKSGLFADALTQLSSDQAAGIGGGGGDGTIFGFPMWVPLAGAAALVGIIVLR